MLTKPVAQKFKDAVDELEKLAGENVELKDNLTKWIEKYFRIYEFKERITTADRLRHRMDLLMQNKTNQLVMTTMRHMSHHGDLCLVTVQTPEKEIELQASVLCFAAGAISNETEPTDVA